MSLVGLFALLVGCGDEEIRDGENGPVINAGDVSVFSLQPGDCLDPDPEISGDEDQIRAVPCEQPHRQEVYAVVELTLDAYPGAAGVAELADRECIAKLGEEPLGLTLDDGVFFSYLLPTFQGWNVDGDRDVVCVLVFPTEDEVTGSVWAGTRTIPRAQPAPPRLAPTPGEQPDPATTPDEDTEESADAEALSTDGGA